MKHQVLKPTHVPLGVNADVATTAKERHKYWLGL